MLCKGDKDAADLILRYEPERIHTLVPGVMLLRYLANRYDAEDITVSHYGVREGYLHRKRLRLTTRRAQSKKNERRFQSPAHREEVSRPNLICCLGAWSRLFH